MDNQTVLRRWAQWALCVFTAVVVLNACHSIATIDHEATARSDRFQEQLAWSTQAINAGDLEQARAHLEAARDAASSSKERQKVDSLDKLIVGAEALMEGDPARARSEWSWIDEPNLSREVRHKARLMGLSVPVVPAEGETK